MLLGDSDQVVLKDKHSIQIVSIVAREKSVLSTECHNRHAYHFVPIGFQVLHTDLIAFMLLTTSQKVNTFSNTIVVGDLPQLPHRTNKDRIG